MSIENTAERDPLLHFLGLLDGGSESYITGMEKQGQAQVVHSDKLPTEGDWEKAESLGVIRGELDERDPLFTSATLPEGWTRASTSHDMYSDILDERGIKRISIGYKAAFYDRWARFSIVNIGWNIVTELTFGDAGLVLPDFWEKLTRDEQESALMAAHRQLAQSQEDAERMPGNDYWTDKVERNQKIVDFLEGVEYRGEA